jgi:capsular exopolysaccharide synthesis family protein
VLAVIPKDVPILKDAPSACLDAEGYRIMRTNIEFNRKSPDVKTITIVSGGIGEGKSTTLNNLAFTFASGGYRTLIVDADLRRPSQHRFFDISNERGLSDYLTTDISLEDLVHKTEVPNLSFLPSGRLPVDAVGILNSQRMIDLMEQVKHDYDIVFFDSPPILGVSDASVIASAVDMTIIVVQHRRFPRSMMLRVKQALVNVGANIIGCMTSTTNTTRATISTIALINRRISPQSHPKHRRAEERLQPMLPISRRENTKIFVSMKKILSIIAIATSLMTGSLTCYADDVALRTGDQLTIRLGGVPVDEISQVSGIYTVDGKGDVNLPYLGKIHAGGLKQADVQSNIETAYKTKGIYSTPVITISVQFDRLVDVSGEVRVPQRVHYTQDLTLLGAIAATGGFTDYVDETKVAILRNGTRTLVNIKKVRKNEVADPTLEPGDKILVPKSFF